MAIAGGHGKRLVQWPPKAWFIRKKSYDRYWLDPSKKLSSKEAAAKLKNTPLHFRVKLFTQEESTKCKICELLWIVVELFWKYCDE